MLTLVIHDRCSNVISKVITNFFYQSLGVVKKIMVQAEINDIHEYGKLLFRTFCKANPVLA